MYTVLQKKCKVVLSIVIKFITGVKLNIFYDAGKEYIASPCIPPPFRKKFRVSYDVQSLSYKVIYIYIK